MGVSAHIDATKYPDQGRHLFSPVEVLFNYSADKIFKGVIIRIDITAPFLCLILLEDGRVISDGDCQWRPLSSKDAFSASDLAHKAIDKIAKKVGK